MRCLYEVLEVEPSADAGAIRTAYRKAALKWHPDKNQDDPNLASERFKEIQNAYEILSDAHERSWYDSHRDAILRSGERHQAGDGGAGFEGGQRPADDVDLFAYFSSTCYSGFGDGPRGFYAVYDELFQRLARQEGEARAARAERRDGSPPPAMPRFGSSGSPWAEVAAFYAEWGGFSTAKQFAWADQYNPASAPNRRVRRAMEAENEKARRAVRREYNDSVRELAAFLRKRDKRVAARQVEEARRAQERQGAEAARREAERRERAARAAAYEDAWESASVEHGGGSGSDEEAGDLEVLYCVACEKHFKSEAAFGNHERSKKHRDRVELLRVMLEEDDAAEAAAVGPAAAAVVVAAAAGASGGGTAAGTVPAGSASAARPDHATEQERSDAGQGAAGSSAAPLAGAAGSSAGGARSRSSSGSSSASGGGSSFGGDDGGSGLPSGRETGGPAAGRGPPPAAAPPAEDEGGASDEELGEDAMYSMLVRAFGGARVASARSDDERDGGDGGGFAPQRPQHPQEVPQQAPAPGNRPASREGSGDDAWGPAVRKPGKRRGGARRQANAPGAAVPPGRRSSIPPSAAAVQSVCAVCGDAFASRSQLFKHVAAVGHAAAKDATSSGGGELPRQQPGAVARGSRARRRRNVV